MLNRFVKDFPALKKLTLWFDSCVPQNRDSHISVALWEFLLQHDNIQVIEQTFCESGHSSIQEVDNIHSQIEKALPPMEIWSPLGLIQTLLTVNRKRPYRVVQMHKEKFKNYGHISSMMQLFSTQDRTLQNLHIYTQISQFLLPNVTMSSVK